MSTADSLLLKVAEGDELWHPCLWVTYSDYYLYPNPNPNPNDNSSDISMGNFFKLDIDSAGIYMTENNVVGESCILRYKMELLWKYYDSIQVAIIGSSRSFGGVNPILISSGYAVNFSHVPNDIYISEYFIQNYFLPLFPKLKTIVVSLDLDMWYKIKGSDWNTYYKESVGYQYDQNHNFWKDGIPVNILEYTENAWGGSPDLRLQLTDSLGYNFQPSVGWGSSPEISRDSIFDNETTRLGEAMTSLENIILRSRNFNINVIGVIFPLSPLYAQTGSYGRYGLRRSKATALIEQLKVLEKIYSNFVLFDENKYGAHDYDDSKAANWDHLSGAGAAQLTTRLDSLLKTLE